MAKVLEPPGTKAPDSTQPGLPLEPGKYSTTTLFAALNVPGGTPIPTISPSVGLAVDHTRLGLSVLLVRRG